MWFDVSAAVVRLQTSGIVMPLKVAEIAKVAGPTLQTKKSKPAPRSDGLNSDAGAYLDFLQLHGTCTYGAFAKTRGWAATRAWQAEAQLRAAGLIAYDGFGRTVLKESI